MGVDGGFLLLVVRYLLLHGGEILVEELHILLATLFRLLQLTLPFLHRHTRGFESGAGIEQFVLLTLHLGSLFLQDFALHTLESAVLANVAHTSDELVEILGREDEHQLLLRRRLSLHIDHGTGVFPFLVGQFALQAVEFGFETCDVVGQRVDVVRERVDALLLATDAVVEDEDRVEALLDVAVQLLGTFLLQFALARHVLLLSLQLCLGRFLLLLLLTPFAFLRLLGGRLALLRRATTALCCCGEQQARKENQTEQAEGKKLFHLFD